MLEMLEKAETKVAVMGTEKVHGKANEIVMLEVLQFYRLGKRLVKRLLAKTNGV